MNVESQNNKQCKGDNVNTYNISHGHVIYDPEESFYVNAQNFCCLLLQ